VPLFLFAVLSLEAPACAQTGQLSDSSLHSAEINRRIDEQLSANKDLSLKLDKLKSDSATADAKADKRIDSLAGIIGNLDRRAGLEKTARTGLGEQLSSLEAGKAAREGEREVAAHNSHLVIAAFGPLLDACKDSAEAANSGLDLARSDSADLVKRFLLESSRQRDSLAGLEAAVERGARALDSLGTVAVRLAHDSLAAAKKNGDSLAASVKRLADLRLLVAGKDSAVRSATEEMNSSRRDSLSARMQDQKDMQKRERDIAALDSIVVAMQDDKNKFFRMREKFQLDSAIETLSRQLNDFLNKPYEVRSAATGSDAEKAQTLDVYKGKLDNLMRDEAFAALVAKFPGKTWREQNRQVTGLLDAAQKTLDSASLTREQIVRDGVLAEKQFAQVTGNFATDNKRLNDLIAKTWKELINAKPRIVRMERDSAEAVKRCETSSAAFQKARAAFLADSAHAAAAADSMARLRDALKGFIAARESARQKELANASRAIIQAAEPVRRSTAAMDAVLAKHQAARDDSIRINNEKSVYVVRADAAIESKKEELRLAQSASEALAGEESRVRSDSSAAVNDKREQENVFGPLLADARRKVQNGDEVMRKLESERDAAVAPKAPSPTAVPAPAPVVPAHAETPAAAPAPVPEQSATREAAQRQLTLIYDLIDGGKPDAARRVYTTNRKLLEKNLDAEAFQVIETTIESLEPPRSPATKFQEAPVASPAADTAPSIGPQPAPVPAAPMQPSSETDVDQKPATVFISSVPPVASVYMDGQQIGRTNTGFVTVTSGKHTMQFIKGDKTCTKEMTFIEGQNPAVVVKLPCGQ
jgi:hypothetical protein